MNNGKGSSLTWAAMFTTLACLTRYIGVTIVVTVVMLLLLKRDTILEQFKRIAAYFMVSLTPLGVWMLRNLMATERSPATGRIRQTIHFWSTWNGRPKCWQDGYIPA